MHKELKIYKKNIWKFLTLINKKYKKLKDLRVKSKKINKTKISKKFHKKHHNNLMIIKLKIFNFNKIS